MQVAEGLQQEPVRNVSFVIEKLRKEIVEVESKLAETFSTDIQHSDESSLLNGTTERLLREELVSAMAEQVAFEHNEVLRYEQSMVAKDSYIKILEEKASARGLGQLLDAIASQESEISNLLDGKKDLEDDVAKLTTRTLRAEKQLTDMRRLERLARSSTMKAEEELEQATLEVKTLTAQLQRLSDEATTRESAWEERCKMWDEERRNLEAAVAATALYAHSPAGSPSSSQVFQRLSVCPGHCLQLIYSLVLIYAYRFSSGCSCG
jgi:chromosome segregation ATPase